MMELIFFLVGGLRSSFECSFLLLILLLLLLLLLSSSSLASGDDWTEAVYGKLLERERSMYVRKVKERVTTREEEGEWHTQIDSSLRSEAKKMVAGLEIIQPTLSRIHHIGSQSRVGNNHQRFIKQCPIWSGRTRWGDGLLERAENGRQVGRGVPANVQGLPCGVGSPIGGTTRSAMTPFLNLQRLVFDSGVVLSDEWYDDNGDDAFVRRLFGTMFVHPDDAARYPATLLSGAGSESCFPLPLDTPACNAERGARNRWAETFYPIELRSEAWSLDKVVEKVLERQLQKLLRCSAMKDDLLALWPRHLPRPFRVTTMQMLWGLMLLVCVVPTSIMLHAAYCTTYEEGLCRRARRSCVWSWRVAAYVMLMVVGGVFVLQGMWWRSERVVQSGGVMLVVGMFLILRQLVVLVDGGGGSGSSTGLLPLTRLKESSSRSSVGKRRRRKLMYGN